MDQGRLSLLSLGEESWAEELTLFPSPSFSPVGSGGAWGVAAGPTGCSELPQFGLFQAGSLWAGYLPSLSLYFLFCKRGGNDT